MLIESNLRLTWKTQVEREKYLTNGLLIGFVPSNDTGQRGISVDQSMQLAAVQASWWVESSAPQQHTTCMDII